MNLILKEMFERRVLKNTGIKQHLNTMTHWRLRVACEHCNIIAVLSLRYSMRYCIAVIATLQQCITAIIATSHAICSNWKSIKSGCLNERRNISAPLNLSIRMDQLVRSSHSKFGVFVAINGKLYTHNSSHAFELHQNFSHDSIKES